MSEGGRARGGAWRLVNRLRRGADFGRWLVTDFARAPGLELYAARQGRQTARFVAESRAGGTAVQLAPFAAGEIPKVIWMYWAQGEATVPHVVRRCIESWRERNPGWEVRVLDEEAAIRAVDLSDVGTEMPRRIVADVLRLKLLKSRGGVWADATCFCHRPLDDWLPLATLAGFFVFSHPGPDRLVASWFVAAPPGDPLITAWEEVFTRHLATRSAPPSQYFMLHYSLQWRIEREPILRAAWERMAHLPAPPAFALMAALTGDLPLETPRQMIRAGFPVSKLSHKARVSNEKVDAALEAVAG